MGTGLIRVLVELEHVQNLPKKRFLKSLECFLHFLRLDLCFREIQILELFSPWDVKFETSLFYIFHY